MRLERKAALLVTLGATLFLLSACGEDNRDEGLGACDLTCTSDSDCFPGQDCIVDSKGVGCCDRFQDRATLNGEISGKIASSASTAIGGDADVSGKWLRANTAFFFLDSGAGYPISTASPLGVVPTIVILASTDTGLGAADELLIYLNSNKYGPGASINLDGKDGLIEFNHLTFEFDETGARTGNSATQLKGVSYEGRVDVDAVLAGDAAGEEFKITVTAKLITP